MHTTRRPPDPADFPAAHAMGRAAANDGDPAAALRIAAEWCTRALDAAARWCTATHQTEHRARPSIVAVCNALDAALSAPSPETFDVLSRALVRWCAAASERGNASDLAPAMLAAVNAAATLDTVADLEPIGGGFAGMIRVAAEVPEPWKTSALKGARELSVLTGYDSPRAPRR